MDPTEYEVSYKTDKPFLLVFDESYHPLWKAYIGDSELTSIITNSYANGFYVKPLEGKIKIEFTEQKTMTRARLISMMLLGASILTIMLLHLKMKRN